MTSYEIKLVDTLMPLKLFVGAMALALSWLDSINIRVRDNNV